MNDGFEDLHFSHGYRRTSAVESLIDDPRSELSAIVDANRSFAGCTDRGILLRWVETPVCGESSRGWRGPTRAPLEGPELGRCLAFDTACSRGRFEEADACCAIEVAPAGTVCEAGGAMLCNGGGECVSATNVPVAQRVPEPSNWLTLFSSGPPARDLIPVEVAVTVPALSSPPGMPLDSLEIWAPVTGEIDPGFDIGVPVPEPTGAPEEPAPFTPDILAIVPASFAGTSRVTILRSAEDAQIQVVGYDGPSEPHALVLSARDAPITEVFVVRGALDTLPAVMSDGSTAGAERIRCSPPGDPGPGLGRFALPDAPRCWLYGDRAVVVGPTVSLAWVPLDFGGPIQLIDGPFGFQVRGDVLPQEDGGLRADRFCTSRRCEVGTCGGVTVCIRGRPSACIARGGLGTESCDGSDNDCDGRVDENASAICNDGIGCTIDTCAVSTGSGPPRACVHRPYASLCPGGSLPGGADGTSCSIEACTNAAGVSNTRRPVSAADLAAATPTATNGCSIVLGHSWCTNSWDSCGCNGPELCVPGPAGGASGCVPAPAPMPVDPCDADMNFCTLESVCCEADSSYCRLNTLLASSPGGEVARDARAAACALPGSSASTYPQPPEIFTAPLPIVCSATSPPVPNCRDFNPCTSDSCSTTTGCANTPVGVGIVRLAETIAIPLIGDRTGPDCIGETEFGCADAMCNGAGACVPNPSSFSHYPEGTNSPVCFDGLTEDFCGQYSCDGRGGCNIEQRDDLPAGGTTTHCGFRPRGSPPDTDCVHDGCVGGFCVRDYPDSRLCARPSGCLPWTCAPDGVGGSTDQDVLPGCVPDAGECYVGGTNDGTLDGTCYSTNETRELTPCLVCDPVRDPYDFVQLSAGSVCFDGNDCTVGDMCTSTGACVGTCIPGCGDEEFCGL